VAHVNGDRDGLASAGRDLRYWKARRAEAVVMPEQGNNSVARFGHTVTIVRDDGREQTFRIVGEDEADSTRGTISHVSLSREPCSERASGTSCQSPAARRRS
jgi:transcription elongation GreA/GreB family factor